jgi:hypothetical protein
MSISHDPAIARADHQESVTEFLAAARAVPANRWERKRDGMHWSPAQICEHVRLTYDVVSAQFDGGPGLRVRTSWWARLLLRWKFLNGILERGIFPKGAKAPREIRPGDGPFDRATVLAALEQSARATEEKFVAHWTTSGHRMTHHVFGELSAPQGARLITVHTQHHASQLRETAGNV